MQEGICKEGKAEVHIFSEHAQRAGGEAEQAQPQQRRPTHLQQLAARNAVAQTSSTTGN